jgi:acetyl esterase
MTYAFDPELAPLVHLLPAGDLDDVEQSRAWIETLIAPLNADVDTTGVDVDDREIPGPDTAVPVRVYAPSGQAPAGGRPALLDIHGGGFVVGSIAMEHAFATQVARELGAVVVAVEYRLAPEHPFPAGVEDCYAALHWMHEHAAELGIDPERIAVGGHAAGAGLAAAVALLARDQQGPPIRFQLLNQPELDDRQETWSARHFTDLPWMNRDKITATWRHYLGGSPASPYAAPARADDLSGLPPAYIEAGSAEVFRDEDVAYATGIWAAGGQAELHIWAGGFHGFDLICPTARVSVATRAARNDWLARLLRG